MKSVHHLYPKNWIDWRWLNVPSNRVAIEDTLHVNHHRIFKNYEFHRQILCIIDFNRKILKEEIIQRVSDIMLQDSQYIYKNWVFIPRK